MRIIYTLVADCEPPPSDDYMQLHGDELDAALEEELGQFLILAGASFSLDLSVRREL